MTFSNQGFSSYLVLVISTNHIIFFCITHSSSPNLSISACLSISRDMLYKSERPLYRTTINFSIESKDRPSRDDPVISQLSSSLSLYAESASEIAAAFEREREIIGQKRNCNRTV